MVAVNRYLSYLCQAMDKIKKETLIVRITSVGLIILAFAVFQPLGLNQLGWMMFVHLLAIWAIGIGVCYITEIILTNLLHHPASLDKGAEYIIHRNLWFQLINTPFEALMICVYLHFILSGRGSDDPLSLKGLLQTILLIAFCSFAIGLYWRFKYRSRYLAAELEETRLLNQQLQKMQQVVLSPLDESHKGETLSNNVIKLKGTTNDSISFQISDLLYVEAVGNYVKVYHLREGKVHSDMLRATSKQIENDLRAYPLIVRCHRAFVVNLQQVEQIISKSGSMQLLIKHCHDYLPVSRSNISQVKESIKNL